MREKGTSAIGKKSPRAPPAYIEGCRPHRIHEHAKGPRASTQGFFQEGLDDFLQVPRILSA